MSRVSQAQMKKLLDLLSEDGVLVNGKVAYKNTNKPNFWKQVALHLNSVEDGAYKNTWKWCKMWADWKNKTKKKATILLKKKKNYSSEHPTPSLSPLERRLLKLINLPLHEKIDAITTEVETKTEPPDHPHDIHIEYIKEPDEIKDGTSSESENNDSDSFDGNSNRFQNVQDFSDEKDELAESSDFDDKVKVKEKRPAKRKLSLEEFKLRTKYKLDKERVQQKSEELRLRALELKLKGDELRLKEIEMNKINYLTNIEEEKLKCFRDISSTLKEFLERSSGNIMQ